MNNQPNTSGSGKKFYISLLCAAALMVIIGIVGMQISKNSEDSDRNLAQIENKENEQNFAQSENPENVQKPESIPDSQLEVLQSNTVEISQGTELEDFSSPVFSSESESLEEKKEKEEETKQEEKETKKNSSKKNKKKKQKEEASETFNTTNPVFPEEDGLLWPLTGDILLNYSMDKGVYFKTLGQYKCNPAILIQGSEGDKILSSCNGTVLDIVEDAETGLTVTMSAGDDSNGSHYEIIYGQLDNLKVAKGEKVEKGQIIGTLAKPSKYYVSEGTHLYYKVLENGEPSNPLLLLQ